MTDRRDDTGAKPRRHGIITGVAGLMALAIVTAVLTNYLTKPGSAPPNTVATNVPPASPPEAVSPDAPTDIPAPVPTPAPEPQVTIQLPPLAQPAPQLQIQPPQQPPQPQPPAQPQPQAEKQIPAQPQTRPPPPQQLASEMPAWLKFAAPVVIEGNRVRVAIVIDDLGLDRPRTARAINLPAAVTLSFLAYSGDLPRQTGLARDKGHELLVHVPMEPVNVRQDMGPNGLSTTQPRDEVLRRLRWDLDRFDGYVGINNHMGSRFTGDEQAMDWVLGELKQRGLLFLDSRTIAASTGQRVAVSEGVPYVARDVFLDDDQSATAVAARLREVEALAKRRGTAVAIGHPHDATLDALASWIATLPQKGITLVPLTEIVKTRTRS